MKKTVLQSRRGACLLIAALWVAPVAQAQTESSPQVVPQVDEGADNQAQNLQATAPQADQAEPAGTEAAAVDPAPAVDCSGQDCVPPSQDIAPPVIDDSTEQLGLRFAAGLNLRTDLGVHSTRVDFTARYQDFELDLVVDPMLWTNGQMHNDLLLQWHSGVGISPLLGLRLSTLPLLDGPQMQYNALLGVAADLPSFFNGAVQGQAGFELAMTVVKSGGGLPAETISFESGRSYIDLVNMALFVRYNFGLGL